MALFGKKQSGKQFVVVSIDSGSVGLAVISESFKEKIPVRTVLYKIRQDIIIPQSITMEVYRTATTDALKKVLEALMTAKVPVPREVHVIFSTPWQSSQTRFVSFQKEKAFKTSKKIIHDLMKKEEMQFVAEAKANPAVFGNDFELFETKIMSATLNGYPIADPEGKLAKTIEITVHLSGASKDALVHFSETIRQIIPHANVSFHSSVFSFFAVLRDIFPEVKSFLIIEVSEMLSELTIVENNALSQSLSFPGGLHTQMEVIAKELGKSEKEAATYLRMHSEGALEEGLRAGVAAALKKTQDTWATFFGQSISSLSKDVIVPDAIFLVTSGQSAGWVEEAVQSEVLLDYKIASQSFTLLSITPSHFNDFITTTGETGHDVPLELGALYISTKI